MVGVENWYDFVMVWVVMGSLVVVGVWMLVVPSADQVAVVIRSNVMSSVKKVYFFIFSVFPLN